MSFPSPRSNGKAGQEIKARVWPAAAAAVLALALLSVSRPESSIGSPHSPIPELVIDPNTAPAGALSALPRVGPVLLGRIVDARTEKPFQSLDDLDRRVRGIGPATLAALRPHLRIEPAGSR